MGKVCLGVLSLPVRLLFHLLGLTVSQPTDGSPLLPFNRTLCLARASGRAGASALCDAFGAFAGGSSAVTPASCIGRANLTAAGAYICLLESRCIAAYDVRTCVGPRGFAYIGRGLFNSSACEALVAQENATLLGTLVFAPGAGCAVVRGGEPPAVAYTDEWAVNRSGRAGLPPLPSFHPCAGGVLVSERAERLLKLSARASRYTTHHVLALSPSIGPVAGGASIGVCGLGFTMANEAVGHLACKFTDGRNEVAVAAVWIDEHQLRCDAPDFSRFAVGMPHNVSVEISTNRGATWTSNHAQFTYYSTRPSIDAFGRAMWGYEPTFTQAAWQVPYAENDFGSIVRELYSPKGHPLNRGRPSKWDSHSDPFHATGESAAWNPVEMDTGDRFEPAEDVQVRASHGIDHGVEGSWGDRRSFLRAHNLVPDVYMKKVVAARARLREQEAYSNTGVI